MAQNTTPIFPLVPGISWVSGGGGVAGTPGLVANTTTDLTAGTIYGPLFTAGANGSRVDFLRSRVLGTNVTTVIRVWVNNGSVTTTAANNTLFMERTLSSSTVSQVAEQPDLVIPLAVSLPAGYSIYATFGTAVAAGFNLTVVGGDY